MASIPGPIFVIVGVAMAVYSYFVKSKSENPILNIFLYIGGLFVFWGLIKIIFKSTRRENAGKTMQKSIREAKIRHIKSLLFCPRCGTRQLQTNNKFCHMCGYHLR